MRGESIADRFRRGDIVTNEEYLAQFGMKAFVDPKKKKKPKPE